MFWPAKRTYGPCKARPAGVAVAVGRSGGAEVGGGFVAMGGEVGGKLATDPHARTSSAVVRIVAAVGLGICPPLVWLTPRPLAFSIRGRQSIDLVAAGFSLRPTRLGRWGGSERNLPSPSPLPSRGRGESPRCQYRRNPKEVEGRGGDSAEHAPLLIRDMRFF